MGLGRITVCLILAGAAVDAARRAWAEALFDWPTRARLEQAAGLDPGNAFHHLALGRWREEAEEDPRTAYRAAVERLPADAFLWIKLGLAEEIAGNTVEAERCLIEASRRSRKYDPRWTLANFYFRRQQLGEFARWAQAAATIAYADITPLFDLSWSLLGSGERIRHAVLPERRETWWQYASWSAANRRWTETAIALEHLGKPAEPSERPRLATLATALVNSGHYDDAWRAWRRLGGRDVPQLEWMPVAAPGVSITVLEAGKRWRAVFNGDQPERLVLLTRLLPPDGGRTSELRWKPSAGQGQFVWEAAAAGDSRVVARAGFEQGYLPFQAAEWTRVNLIYQRPPGRMRYEGPLTIEDLEVRDAP